MVKLRQLIGAAPVVHFECMYTKHKTQKRKTWHDGFVSLYDSRRLMLYDEAPLTGTLLEDVKIAPLVWESKDEDYIDVPKFLIEIIDTTPINVGAGASSATPPAPSSSFATARPSETASYQEQRPISGLRGNLGARGPSSLNGKFKTPLMRPGSARLTKSSAPQGQAHPYATATSRSGLPSARNGASAVAEAARFDFERRPTSEWDYKPGAIKRTPDQVLALLDQQ